MQRHGLTRDISDMNGIEDLRERVTDAVAHFGQINEQRATYSQRLLDLMNTIEGRIRDQLREIEEHKAKIAHHIAEMESQSSEVGRIDRENEQLRAMLHALLQAIEAGGYDSLAETLQELEQKASALTDGTAPAAPVAEEIAEPVAEIEDAIVEAPGEEPDDAAEAARVEEIAEPLAEAEEDLAEAPAEVEEAAAEEPVLADGAIAPGDVLDSAEIAEEPEAEIAAATEAPAAEEPEAPAAEAEEPAPGDAGSGSLDEIMARVSKLVEETEAAIAAPEPVAKAPEDPVEEPAQQASAGS